MSVVAIVLISGLFVLAAMVGVADAFVHFVCWGASRLASREASSERGQRPAQGITA